MKVLFLTSLFPNKLDPTNGVFNLSRLIALKKINCEVSVISPIGLTPKESDLFPIPKFYKIYKDVIRRKQLPSKTVVEGSNVYYPKWFWLPRRFFWKYELIFLKLFAGKNIKAIIQSFQPDVIITTWFHPYGTYSKYINKYYSGKIVSITEGSDLLIMPFRISGWNYIQKTFNESSSLLVFVSKSQKQFVEDKLKLKNGIVIENGFNTQNFYFTDSVRRKASTSVKLIIVGNLFSVKGHDLLLKAMLLLDNSFSLTIIGEGEKMEEYVSFVKENGLESRVNFVGKVMNQDIKSYLDESDIYCQPSRSEGFPAGPLEAMGCGLPVIVSDVGGMPETIIPGFNGYVFEKENVQDLVNKIVIAASTNWNYLAISEWVKTKYSWEIWAKKVIEMLNDENIQLAK